jgi:2-oxoglutarate dehydrogenase E2 component (dihydrolipoamide succinyltransferase)
MTNIVVPELGESVVEARVARWLKKEGDRVELGEPLVELETEKVDLEVNADKSGVLASIKRQEGEDVKIGELLGVVDESASAPAPAPPPPSGNGSGDTATKSTAAAPACTRARVTTASPESRADRGGSGCPPESDAFRTTAATIRRSQ